MKRTKKQWREYIREEFIKLSNGKFLGWSADDQTEAIERVLSKVDPTAILCDQMVTYNVACAEIDNIFAGMKVEVMGDPSKRVVFFVDHKAVAQYKESTGILAWYSYGKELKTSVVASRNTRYYGMMW